MKATFKKYRLNFKQAAGTSRGVYLSRDIWFLFITDGEKTGIGECAPLPELSIDNINKIDNKLLQVSEQIDYFVHLPVQLREWPSIQFAIEMAILDLKNGANKIIFPSDFSNGQKGIKTNGLIWMGKKDEMKLQIKEKLKQGFKCIKMKIGALDFDTEFEVLQNIRKEYSENVLCIRVDANGAYNYKNALEKMKRLSDLKIHSIEQPIEAGNWDEMAKLCHNSPLPVALDEELIGITATNDRLKLIETIKPEYLILKPSLLGGFASCDKWISIAETTNTGWWATSALESNIGLNAIAQWTFTKSPKIEQGLGTGQLYTNNFDSPLEIFNQELWHKPEIRWNMLNLYVE